MTQGWVYDDKIFIFRWTVFFTLQSKHLWMKQHVSNKQLSVKKAGYASNFTPNSVVATIHPDPRHSDSTFNFTPGKGICTVTKPSATRAELYRGSLRSFALILKAIFTLHQKDCTYGLSYHIFLVLTTEPSRSVYCNFSRESSSHKGYFFPGMRNYLCSQTVHHFPIWIEIKRVFPI